MMRSSVDLPQPDGPISETNSPGCDLEVDLLRARSRRPWNGFGQALDRDGRTVAHAMCSGARRTTSFSASTIATKKAMPSSAATMFVAQRFAGRSSSTG